MSKPIIFVLVGIFFSLSLFGKSYDVSRYGALPNTDTNIAVVLQSILTEIATTKDNNPQIIFQKGTYHFFRSQELTREYYISNHDQDNPKYLGAILENIQNLTIEGNGSKFIFHGRMLPLSIVNSKNITLKNFSIDFDDPKILQLTKIASNNNNTYKVEEGAKYAIQKGHLVLEGEGYHITPITAIIFDGEKKNIHPQTSDYVPAGFMFYAREVELGVVSLSDVGLKSFPVGTKVACRSYGRPTPGIFISHSQNIKMQGVTVHHSEGMGLLAQLSSDIRLDNFSVVPPEGSVRAYTTQADSTHFSGCKGLIDVQNSTFEGMMDDAINVHGTYLKVKQIKGNTVIAKYMHGQTYGFDWGFKGDQVAFIKSSTMDSLCTNEINEIQPYREKKGGFKQVKITFKNPIDKRLVNGSVGIENLSWTPEVVFNNNVIRNNRARGVLFSSPRKTVCNNNLFETVSGSAILLCGDCNGWFEGGSCTDVEIKGNRFVNNLTSVFQFTNAIISIFPVVPNLASQKGYFHRNIVIDSNNFVTFDRPLLYAKSTTGLSFVNNVIIGSKEFMPYHFNKSTFNFERCKNITIDKNRFMDSYGFNPFYDIRMQRCDNESFVINHSRNF